MKRFIKVLSVNLMVFVLISLITACTIKSNEPTKQTEATQQATTTAAKETEQQTQKGKKVEILLCYKGDQYVLAEETIFKYYGMKNGWDVNVVDGKLDAAIQAQQIEDAVTKKVDVIAIQPMDTVSLKAPLELAVEKGIKVFSFNVKLDSDKIVANITMDDYMNGFNLGEWAKNYINTKLGGKAEVGIIDLPVAVNTCVPRVNGFKDALKDMPGVKIVGQQDGKAQRDVSMKVAENMLTANPDIKVFMGINYDTAAGAASAIQAAGKDAIALAGGWGKEMFQMIEKKDPYLVAMWNQSAFDEAMYTVNAIKDTLDGKQVEKSIICKPDPKVWDATNIDRADYKKVEEMEKELAGAGK